MLKEILDNIKSDEYLNFLNKFKLNILEVCRVKRRIESFCFVDVLLEMVGMYIKLCESEFIFIYEFLFEIVVYYFGS